MFTIEVLSEAENELKDACDWYDSRQKGLAKRFLNEIDQCLNAIRKNPDQFQVRFSETYRFAPLKKFL
ncbi:type II toxin-antitoxin system RelE/ParE family toxin [Mucilaginibacter sp. RS28]|uniref:Type II toxin-antitoxin system RelE/ParE family toxin n=1 Tax=Mucilaginibacter straminoryzae TaxID=2932774 RepID=A0A9X1X3D5_9SPHI|nr:type II toxin-antitoxin system RelE/ParE family toxin [Mucilaginibacter straminoryzae]MCJ8210293.1 type II toxin-antitoxin system RelE/ParE family toxin [Mucilaginibacter straminoryzae]